jgi:hypothetical protein
MGKNSANSREKIVKRGRRKGPKVSIAAANSSPQPYSQKVRSAGKMFFSNIS